MEGWVWVLGCNFMVKCLPSISKALGWISSTAETKQEDISVVTGSVAM